MAQQLIITILGADKAGLLSQIAQAVSEENCNILDSRQAVYGKDFTLTMIIEGNITAITRAEIRVPALCAGLDLLSMTKRTTEHNKQNLEQLLYVEFRGVDAVGQLLRISQFFSEHNGLISALRQKTFDSPQQQETMQCKLVVSLPALSDVENIRNDFSGLLKELHLQGNLLDTPDNKEHNESIDGWQ